MTTLPGRRACASAGAKRSGIMLREPQADPVFIVVLLGCLGLPVSIDTGAPSASPEAGTCERRYRTPNVRTEWQPSRLSDRAISA
jgi:hypothetical protein